MRIRFANRGPRNVRNDGSNERKADEKQKSQKKFSLQILTTQSPRRVLSTRDALVLARATDLRDVLVDSKSARATMAFLILIARMHRC
jgi:hypothetical protein